MASRFRGCSHSGEKRSGKSAGRERDGSTIFTLFFNTDVSSRHCHTGLHLIFYLRDDALSLQLAALLDFRPRTNGLVVIRKRQYRSWENCRFPGWLATLDT
uniref:(northern house mosquito) hypothetical protein n=1 Tax=Culex pipiens TaxID=7175 RepID=A0A8D8DJU2_CULPI